MEWSRHKTLMVTAILVTFLACAAIFAYFDLWAPPRDLDLVALHILPAPSSTASAPEKAPVQAYPLAVANLPASPSLPVGGLDEVEFLALLVDPAFSALLNDLMFDAFLSARLDQLLGVQSPSLVTATALASLPFVALPSAEFSSLSAERSFNLLPGELLLPDLFASARLPSDAPLAEFPLMVAELRQSDWYTTHEMDMDMSPNLTPSEASIIDRMRSDITGAPASSGGTPSSTPSGPSGPSGPSTPETPPTPPTPPPPNPPPVSNSGL